MPFKERRGIGSNQSHHFATAATIIGGSTVTRRILVSALKRKRRIKDLRDSRAATPDRTLEPSWRIRDRT